MRGKLNRLKSSKKISKKERCKMYYYYVKTRGKQGRYSFEDFVRTQNEIKQAFDNMLKESIGRLTNNLAFFLCLFNF